ncbi:MAG: hypothetical protein AAFM92_00255 [Pseudomonadota bacterium]
MTNKDNSLIIFFNGLGIAVSYVMLSISLWLSTDVPLATKGFWGIGVLMLTLSLVNFVKFRFDAQSAEDRIAQLEAARNEKLLKEYVDGEE